ncbi:MAG: NAD(P)H-dependent glycerol-3-phosphate dehydrogenase [Verrucomicrobiota bacterium]
MRIAVIGAGAWGTALANLLCENDHDVTLWGHDEPRLEEVRRTRRNECHLPGIELSSELKFEKDLSAAVQKREGIVIAVPSKFFREVTSRWPRFEGIAISVTKGIEYETGLTMSGVLKAVVPGVSYSALSGPTLALEVAKNIPAAIVAASHDSEVAQAVQNLFLRPTFRVYTSSDLLGVELGGALKNVIAIAAGMSDGLGFGDNAKAALVTRAIVEIRRLGVACGANPETFSGLSGLGDLTVTCFSKLSRNRGFGERLGRGETVQEILASTSSVAEGYPTARSAFQLAKNLNIETPIIDEVYAMLYAKKPVRQAVQDLMGRDTKPED